MAKKLLILVALLVLCACSQPQTQTTDFDFVQNYTMKEYVVEHKDGYEMDVVEINHSHEVDFFEEWQERQEKKEQEDRYEMIRDVYERRDREQEEEEYKLKTYCESLHSNTCLDMEWIKDHNGCRKVEITCEQNDTDDICVEYEVEVSEDTFEEDLC